MDNKFGETIRELRINKDLGLREFAKQLEITPAYLSNIERGKFNPPSEEKIIRIAEKLGADSNFLLRLAKKVPPEIQKAFKQDEVIAEYAPTFLKIAKNFSKKDWKEVINLVKNKLD